MVFQISYLLKTKSVTLIVFPYLAIAAAAAFAVMHGVKTAIWFVFRTMKLTRKSSAYPSMSRKCFVFFNTKRASINDKGVNKS